MTAVLIIILAIAALYLTFLIAHIPRPMPGTGIGHARDGGNWVSIFLDVDPETGRKTYEEAFVVTEQGDFRWLEMEVRLNDELVGEDPEAGVTILREGVYESTHPGVHDLRMGDFIRIENVGRAFRDGDSIVVHYNGQLLASTIISAPDRLK